MEAIDVFRRMDALDDLRAADLPGQRQLHQDAIHPLVGVELIDQSEELGLRSQRRQVVGERHDADLFTGATLAAHVHRGGWVIADLDDCESGAPCAAGYRRGDGPAHLGLDVLSQLPAVDELCCHALRPGKKGRAFSHGGNAPRACKRHAIDSPVRSKGLQLRAWEAVTIRPHHAIGGQGRGMAQSGSASALGAEGRGFKSLCPDHVEGVGSQDAGDSLAVFARSRS